MTGRRWTVVAGLAVGAAALWLLRDAAIPLPVAPPPSARTTDPGANGAPSAVDAPRLAGDAAARRARVAAAAALPVVPPDPAFGAAAATDVRFVVRDAAGETVANATVELRAAAWERLASPDAAGGSVAWLGPADGPPLLALATDEDGRCAARVQRELVFVRAHHPACGESVRHAIRPARLPPDGTVTLRLDAPALVRGIVLASGGGGVAHAAVTLRARTRGSDAWSTVQRGPLHADGAGRFAFEAICGSTCEIAAAAGGAQSPRVTIEVTDGLEVAVPFSGALAIRGRVVDAAGRPAARAVVDCWRDGEPMLDPPPQAGAGDDGGFELALLAPGRWLVGARTADGNETSPPVAVEVACDRPHAYVDLQTAAAAPIAGVLLRHDGTPARDEEIRAVPLDRRGPVAPRTALPGPDGAFALDTPAGRTWTLEVDGLAPLQVPSGTTGLRLVQQPPLRCSATVEVRTAGGELAEGFLLSWVAANGSEPLLDVTSIGSAGQPGNPQLVTFDGRGPPRRLVAFAAEGSIGVAPPLQAVPSQHVVITVQAPATLPVRVLCRGMPLRAAGVATDRARLHGSGLVHTDADGRARLVGLEPGTHPLRVLRGERLLAQREIRVVAGANPELVIDVAP